MSIDIHTKICLIQINVMDLLTLTIFIVINQERQDFSKHIICKRVTHPRYIARAPGGDYMLAGVQDNIDILAERGDISVEERQHFLETEGGERDENEEMQNRLDLTPGTWRGTARPLLPWTWPSLLLVLGDRRCISPTGLAAGSRSRRKSCSRSRRRIRSKNMIRNRSRSRKKYEHEQ